MKKAKDIAIKVHDRQVDKKKFPYMSHVLDVAKRVEGYGEKYVIVGLLHDAIEDTKKHPNPDELKTEIKNQIKDSFDDEIVEAIFAMTKKPDDDYFDDYLPRVKNNEIAKKVKIADSSHNLSKAHLIEDPDLQEKLRAKYIKVLNNLGEDGSSCEKPIIYENGEWIEK